MKKVFKINHSKTNNPDKLTKQIVRVVEICKDRYGFKDIINAQLGTENDDFVKDKITMVLSFS